MHIPYVPGIVASRKTWDISGWTAVRDVTVCRRERCLPAPLVGLVCWRCSVIARIQAGRFARLSPVSGFHNVVAFRDIFSL